jgi:hypothetical protein
VASGHAPQPAELLERRLASNVEIEVGLAEKKWCW